MDVGLRFQTIKRSKVMTETDIKSLICDLNGPQATRLLKKWSNPAN